MEKSFRKQVYDARTQAWIHYQESPKDKSAELIRELADLLCGICDWIDCAKIRKQEEPQPDDQQDDVDRILEMASKKIGELRSRALATARDNSYGLAHDYTCMADVLSEFYAYIHREFNRD